MSTPKAYRERAAKYGELISGTDNPDEIVKFRKLQRSFVELADNEDWMTNNLNKTVRPNDQ